VNDQVGGGTVQFYKGKASALNDYRIAGQFTQLTGTIPTTPSVTNQNDQPLLIAYHNLEKPDFTLPTNAQEFYVEDAPSDGKLYGRKDGAWVEIV